MLNTYFIYFIDLQSEKTIRRIDLVKTSYTNAKMIIQYKQEIYVIFHNLNPINFQAIDCDKLEISLMYTEAQTERKAEERKAVVGRKGVHRSASAASSTASVFR